jgi:hypothetical protein
MLRLSKKLASLALPAVLALTGECSWGFALLGPINEAYQVQTIGYQLPGDIGAPKNLGEEYRRNMPTLYYSYDAAFLDYFGSNGVAAVDSAIAILNSVTNVSALSHELNEYPLQATRENYLAGALGLSDVKTWALKTMVEQLGLAEPERYAWTLNDRAQAPGASVPCPSAYFYGVIMRNFDPVPSALNQYQATPYVNGTLYSYYISEVCMNRLDLAVTVPFAVDPLDFTYTAVASLPSTMIGQFHTGLTRDDVGGLRYLISPQTYNFESAGPNTQAEVTNPIPQLLFTSNLTLFADLALTNDPVTLSTLIPNLNIINSSNYFVNGFTTNVTPYFTNFPWDPLGTAPHLLFATNLVPTVFTRFNHTFGNLFELGQSPSGPVLVPLPQVPPATNKVFLTIQTDKIGTGSQPWGPAGSTTVTTNSTFTTYLTNAVAGDYFVLPTNLCGIQLLSEQATWVTTATNFLGTVTNSTSITNSLGLTNAGTILIVSQSQISYFTNHAFVALEANCVASGAALSGGVDHLAFVRRDFDSLLGRFFNPITNNYTLNTVTNSLLVQEPIQRTLLAPDFIFSATNIVNAPAVFPPGNGIVGRGINFNQAFANQGAAGPGTIEPQTTVAFDKVGPFFVNSFTTAFSPGTAQAGQAPGILLGSFDGSTNAPIVYPNGTSLINLENQMLIGIAPGALPNGKVGVSYPTTQFSATGGQSPYSWGLAPTSPGLPPGLFLLPNGTLSGTPNQEGTFDFTIMLTDAGGRTVDQAYSITIIP